jgi:hypothetical protein
MTRKIKGIIPVVHFSFKALILRAQSARKMSALSPFLGGVGGGEGVATNPTKRGTFINWQIP